MEPGADVWRNHGGLGKSTWVVYRHLLGAGAFTVPKLSKATGLPKTTVRRALHKLSGVSLAAEARHHRWLGRWRDLDEVAQLLGVQGVGERQRARHQAERESQKAAITKWKASADNPAASPTTGSEREGRAADAVEQAV